MHWTCRRPAFALDLFLAVSLAGIALGVVVQQWKWQGETVSSATRMYYGRKAAKHVAPETLTGQALGADFAEVYVAALSARDLREKGTTEFHEFRPVAYPPLTLRLYSLLAGLSYAWALALHSALSLAMFLAAAALIFLRAGIGRHFWKIAVLTLAVCFCTPAGYSHYERGQFDLYISAAVFLCLATIWLERGLVPSALAGGVFASLKLSSLPFLGTFSLAAFASDGPGRRRFYLIAPAMVALSLFLFAPELGRLGGAMNHMEWAASAGLVPTGERNAINGVSFLLILPPFLAKSVQIFSMAIFIAAARWGHIAQEERHARFAAAAFPFALAMVVQGMAYGAGSWEYRVVSLLGVAAAYVLWVEKVPGLWRIKTFVGFGFAVFLLLATRTFHFMIYTKPSWQAPGMSALYLAYSLACLGLSVWILRARDSGET